MVYFQVEAIGKKFSHFADLEKNQWVVPMEKEVEVKSKPRRSKVPKSFSNFKVV